MSPLPRWIIGFYLYDRADLPIEFRPQLKLREMMAPTSPGSLGGLTPSQYARQLAEKKVTLTAGL